MKSRANDLVRSRWTYLTRNTVDRIAFEASEHIDIVLNDAPAITIWRFAVDTARSISFGEAQRSFGECFVLVCG